MLTIAALVVAVSLPAARVEGAGARVTEARPVAAATAPSALVVRGALTVTLSEGPAHVDVTAEKNLLPLITVDVSGGTITVATKGEPVSEAGVVVHVRLPATSSIKVVGAVHLTAALKGDVAIDASGASEITLKGTVRTLTLGAKGATAVHAAALKADSVKVTIGGAATIDVGPSDALSIAGGGVGRVRYHGTPKLTSTASGTVKVTKAGP